MTTGIIEVLAALVADKAALRKREEKLVVELRETLGRLGYRLEPIGTDGRAGRGTGVTGRHSASPGSTRLTCSLCPRTFALPLHLGRHVSTMHKGNKAAAPKTAVSTAKNGSRQDSASPQAARRRMSPGARRAAARRMKAYWRKRKASAKARARGRKHA
jgi:hypothetical protein